MGVVALAYEPSEIGSARFILGDFFIQATRAVLAPGVDGDNVAEVALLAIQLGSPYTLEDPKFKEDWADNVPGDWKPGRNPVVDKEVRMKQIGCVWRSLIRSGVLAKVAQDAKPYKPKSLAPPELVAA